MTPDQPRRGALPPGQTLTGHFPVVGETAPAAGADSAAWQLSVGGLVRRPDTLPLTEVLARPRRRICDLHCVTGWSRRAVSIEGRPLAELLSGCTPLPQARYVRFVAASSRAHDTSLPLELALADTWLVHRIDGVPLTPEHGAPLRTVTPGRYFYKSLKWLTRIELLAVDRPGYWERESAYHNGADPWCEQRFDESRCAGREDVAALRAAADLDPWRGRTLIRARLGGWRPRDRNLSGLSLKYCSLRRAALAGVDLRGANLSLSNLEGADLRGADLTGADIEGASFAGANLRNARLLDVSASATTFFRDFSGGRRLAAKVSGCDLRGAKGLLDGQIAFLVAAGAVL